MDSQTYKQLQQYCRDNNIRNFSRYTKKQDLLNFINEYNTKSNEPEPEPEPQPTRERQIGKLNNPRVSYNREMLNASATWSKDPYDDELKKVIEESLNVYKESEFLKKSNIENIKKERILQDQEYEKALQQDLLNNENEHKEINITVPIDYQKKMTEDELEHIRQNRIKRFHD